MNIKKMHLYTVGILLLWGLTAQAQKEAYNWFYGAGQGITWNRTQTFQAIPTNAPNTTVPLKDIPTRYDPVEVRPRSYPMHTREGCFSLSDGDGNLLFYSSGSDVYNAEHTIMENATGLEGNFSSAQSGIILPYPEHKKKYIAVSIGVASRIGSFAYNVLDVSVGLGKLELPKNRQFTLPAGTQKKMFVESVMATKHANGIDYWIIAIARTGVAGNSKLVSWLVTKDGVSTTPVTSTIPRITISDNYNAYGYLKISPNAKHFALMIHERQNLLWGDFDNRTGLFSNMNDYYSLTGQSFSCYGGEFSPDSKYLYVSRYNAPSSRLVDVFEVEQLHRGNTTPIKFYTGLSATSNYYVGALQLGPDLRMYLTMSPRSPNLPNSYLYVFDQPNTPSETGVYALKNLSPGTGSGGDGAPGTRFGLPTFAASFFVDISGSATICVEEEAVYTLNSNAAYLEVDFDESEGPQTIRNTEELRHSFKKPGNYVIKISPLDPQGRPIPEEAKTVYTIVYSCYLPVNHNLKNMEY